MRALSPLLARFVALVAAAVVLGASLLAAGPAEARAPFPYNHPDLQWYTIETEHYRVHYPISRNAEAEHYINAEWMARKTAFVSEEMWEPMAREFDYYMTEKVEIIMAEQSDTLVGYTVPNWNIIVISGSPGWFYRHRGRAEWFSDVLVHELAHVVSIKRDIPITEGAFGGLLSLSYNNGVADSIQGATIFVPGRSAPWWYIEGGAEFWSERSGYNWWTSARDATIRTTMLEDRQLTFDEWGSTESIQSWHDGERGYQQGYSIALYLRERFGDEVMARLANEHDKGFRPNWDELLYDLTGVPPRQLYDDWKQYVNDHYGSVYDAIKAEGEARGRELESRLLPWSSTTPDAIDAYYTDKKRWAPLADLSKVKTRRDYEGERDRTGTYDFFPKVSPDGKWVAENARGRLTILPVPERMFAGRSGDNPWRSENAAARRRVADMTGVFPISFGDGYDFVPGKDQVVASVLEDSVAAASSPLPRFETDGYNFKRLAIIDLTPRTDKRKHGDGTEEFETLRPKKFLGGAYYGKERYTIIPNTGRGFDPAVSPDGSKVAFVEYHDGQLNLYTINIDGTDKRQLTHYTDGAQVQGIDWSPDGEKLVFAIFKNYRADLYTINADGTNIQALNADKFEDRDAHWAADGSIYFSSDPTGIYNIYRYDPTEGTVHQITNVIGSATMPSITPSGDLLYVEFTAFGRKSMVLASDEFLEKDVTDTFRLNPDPEKTTEFLDFSEDYSFYEDATTKYDSLKSFRPVTGYPFLQIGNANLINMAISAGGWMQFNDYNDTHTFTLYGSAGERSFVFGNYQFKGLHPNLSVGAYYSAGKSTFGFRADDDNNPLTTEDSRIFDIRQDTAFYGANVGVSYPLARGLQVSLTGLVNSGGFRRATDKEHTPFVFRVGGSIGGIYQARNRAVLLTYTHQYTDILDGNGRRVDDGEMLDAYHSDQIFVDWLERRPIPTFNIPALQRARRHGHLLELEVQGGYTFQNVFFWDEFRLPGRGQLGTRLAPILSGYPGFILLGETMLGASLQYDMPIFRQFNKRFGMFVLRNLNLRFGASAGNIWSFRPPTDSEHPDVFDVGSQLATDNPELLRREIPFVDIARKNGNYLLTDVSMELRLNLGFMNYNRLTSFFRVAYGFNSVGGIFDVDGDGINDATSTGFGNDLSSEREPAGFRFYLGIGQPW